MNLDQTTMSTDSSAKTQAAEQAQAASHGLFSDAWSMVSSAGRVAGQFAVGVGSQIIEHPLETAGEVVGGVVIAGAAVEAGVGAATAAAIAAVPAAAYGAYRGVQIARTEGIGAIPAHVRGAIDDAGEALSRVGNSIATVYSGAGDQAAASAELQNVGRAATPFIAGGIGGTGAEMGSAMLRTAGGGLRTLAEATLPALSLEPAYAGLVPPVESAVVGGAAGAGTLAMSTAIGEGSALKPGGQGPVRDASGSAENDASMLDVQRNRSVLVDGRAPLAEPILPTERGLASKLGEIFQSPARFMGEEGDGFVQVTRHADGDLQATILRGPKQGTVAIYKPGEREFMVSAPGSRVHVFEMPR